MSLLPDGAEHHGRHSNSLRPFLTVKEAAAELRLDESTLYRHLREGHFPGVKVGGRYLIPTAVIEELAAGAMAAGRCVDIEEWAARWRDERAAAALAAGDRSRSAFRRGDPMDSRVSRKDQS